MAHRPQQRRSGRPARPGGNPAARSHGTATGPNARGGSAPGNAARPGRNPQRPGGAPGSSRGPRTTAPSPSSAWRRRLEIASAPVLLTLHRLPRLVLPVVLGLLLFLGLIAPADRLAWAGGLALSLVTLFLAWLLALSWPVLTPGSRLLRVAVVIAVAGVTVLKFVGRI